MQYSTLCNQRIPPSTVYHCIIRDWFVRIVRRTRVSARTIRVPKSLTRMWLLNLQRNCLVYLFDYDSILRVICKCYRPICEILTTVQPNLLHVWSVLRSIFITVKICKGWCRDATINTFLLRCANILHYILWHAVKMFQSRSGRPIYNAGVDFQMSIQDLYYFETNSSFQ